MTGTTSRSWMGWPRIGHQYPRSSFNSRLASSTTLSSTSIKSIKQCTQIKCLWMKKTLGQRSSATLRVSGDCAIGSEHSSHLLSRTPLAIWEVAMFQLRHSSHGCTVSSSYCFEDLRSSTTNLVTYSLAGHSSGLTESTTSCGTGCRAQQTRKV